MIKEVGITAGKNYRKYKTKNGKNGIIYKIDVTGKENVAKFLKKIQPIHPEKKRKLIEILSKSKGLSKSKSEMFELIKSKKYQTSRELASFLKLSIYTIRNHLNNLEKEGKIIRIHKNSNSFVWNLKED